MAIVNSGLFFGSYTLLTIYRSYSLKKMEHICRQHSGKCIFAIDNNKFNLSLLAQLHDDKVIIRLGNCNGKAIIWEDAKYGGYRTNAICLDNSSSNGSSSK